MIPRSILCILVIAFAVLIVAFAVLMGGFGIAATAGDSFGATVLWRCAMGCAVLLAIVTLLTIGTLALLQLDRPSPPRQRPRRRDERGMRDR